VKDPENAGPKRGRARPDRLVERFDEVVERKSISSRKPSELAEKRGKIEFGTGLDIQRDG